MCREEDVVRWKERVVQDYWLLSQLNTNNGIVVQFWFYNRHKVFLYTPVLSENLVTQFLPPRWNEVLSVYHIKSYIFDNNMIISGANLSNDYFTSRIDRYVLFENCPDLINFYEEFPLNWFVI